MLDKELREELINSGKEAIRKSLPASVETENGFTVPLAPLTSAILEIASVGLNALLDALVLKRVDVIGGADTEVIIEIHD
jgi:hypothetical protein